MTQTKSFAALADIHGNALALKAVLDHARQQGISRFVNLGDTFYGPLDPAGTWNILRDMNIPTVLGNQDRILMESGPQWENVPAFARTLEGIGETGLAWLKGLPAYMKPEPNVLLCHGTPKDDTAYLLEDVSTGLPAMQEQSVMEQAIMPEAEGCTLVLAGHSHHAGLAVCNDITVVNPGSVGLPAYDDDTPPYIMASGSPHARYAIFTRTQKGWKTEFMDVVYDWQRASIMAEKNGRKDWAQWLLTGIA